jgi:diadenosine tetraphosphate (Ap4A) HIT family hydrolase
MGLARQGEDVDNWQQDRIDAALRGKNPTVLTRMQSGFAVIGDTQFLPGYCLLLRVPKVGDLTDLPLTARIDFLRDMSLLGEAVTKVCQPHRINYEIFGNTDPFLHAHVLPRYTWEPAESLSRPAVLYPRELRQAPQHQFTEAKHGELKARLTAALLELMQRVGATVTK